MGKRKLQTVQKQGLDVGFGKNFPRNHVTVKFWCSLPQTRCLLPLGTLLCGGLLSHTVPAPLQSPCTRPWNDDLGWRKRNCVFHQGFFLICLSRNFFPWGNKGLWKWWYIPSKLAIPGALTNCSKLLLNHALSPPHLTNSYCCLWHTSWETERCSSLHRAGNISQFP